MIKECSLCFDPNPIYFSFLGRVTCATNLYFKDFIKKFVVNFHDSELLDLLLKHCEISKSFEPFICPAHQGLLDQI